MFSSVVNKIFSPPELLKLDMYRTLPSISRLSESIVQKRKIKFIDYNLNLSILDLSDRICLSMHWHPVVDNKELGKRLPFNWPEIYINEYKQDFNPDSFYSNSLALYKYQSRGKEDEENLILLKDELLKRLLQYSLIQGDARYILYKFDYSLFGGLKAPWVSGFAQGQILSGLVYLHMRFGDEYSLQLAHEIYLSFLKFRNDVDADSFWITEIDNLGFFWIEEYPLKNDPQPKILNGHIWGIYGLYNYYKINPDPEVILLIKASITSVNFYVNQYRIPGTINRYSLYDCKADYSPERTIQQQMDLFMITGETYFLKMSQTFMIDFKQSPQNSLFYKTTKYLYVKIKFFLIKLLRIRT